MTDRAYFFHQGAAGATVSDSATILNSSDKELTFQVFATDAVNTPSGAPSRCCPPKRSPRTSAPGSRWHRRRRPP